jgi:predicted RNA-binding protein with PIN domain
MKRALAILLIAVAAFAVVACDRTPTSPTAIQVVAAPVISQFNTDATNTRLLQWTVIGEGTLRIRIEPVLQNVQAVGAQVVPPDTYTITAENEGGTVRRSCIVK